MPDYRNPNDPLWRGPQYEPATSGSNASWGWIAGAVVLVVLVAVAFGIGHGPTQTASNDTPATNHLAAPPPAPRTMNPGLPGLTPPPAPQGNAQPR
jgi:hypothetical protein